MRPAALICAIALPLLAGCAGTEVASLVSRPTSATSSDAAVAASLISQYRMARGLSPVTVDPGLNKAAEHQARAVASAGSLSHGAFASRMSSFGVPGHAAENLSAGSRSVDQAIARWKASPGHNDNLLMPQARRIGLARADSETRYGRYWALVLSQ